MVGTVQTIQGKKNKTDIGQLIEKQSTTGTEWKTEKKTKNKIFYRNWDPKQHTEKIRCKCRNESVNTE